MDERAADRHAQRHDGAHCAPDDGLLDLLARAARQLLTDPGVSRVRLQAGCHSVELDRQVVAPAAVPGPNGDAAPVAAPQVTVAEPTAAPEQAAPAAPPAPGVGRHRGPG